MSQYMTAKLIISAIANKIGKDSVTESIENEKDPKSVIIRINPNKIKETAEFLKSQDFEYLSFITAVDLKKHIDMVYWFTSQKLGFHACIKCTLPPVNPEIESLCGVYATANWNEREAYDMFGVKFTGHPELKRILTWDEFVGHPLLKKYKVIDDPDVPMK
ncbi:MAG TPA: NADH-quinone oxidoreductase subunit C [Candidatus Wallbacteria bacterium]|nr:NADH-quinone oxidoreductase subunit C [Candidatus Wallbacteria bacterium]